MTNPAPFAALRTSLGAALIERADESDAISTALIAREHVLFVGPPGTAKSAAARLVAATGAVGAQVLGVVVVGEAGEAAVVGDPARRRGPGAVRT